MTARETTHAGHWADRFESFALCAGERDPLWLRSLRANAFDCFTDRGFPTTRQEEWRYTSVAAIAKQAFELGEVAELSAEALGHLALAGFEAPRLVFANGHFDVAASTTGLLSGEALVENLASLRSTGPDRLQPHLGQPEQHRDHAFAALNTAFLDDGAVLAVPRGRRLEQPLHIVYAGVPGAKPTVQHPRTLLVAEAQSQAVVVQDHQSLGGGTQLTNALIEVFVGEGATLDLVLLQRESERTFHVSNLVAHLERDARLRCHTLTIGGSLVRNDLEVELAGQGAETTLNGLAIGARGRLIDNHTLVDHAVPHTSSSELYKGVLGDGARGVFRGRVVVRKDAQKCSALQQNPNLIVSDGSEVDTRPQLEIYADDVTCSHGSSIGQLDADAVFYLRSRGLGLPEARELLTQGFVNEILGALPVESLSGALREIVLAELRAATGGSVAGGSADGGSTAGGSTAGASGAAGPSGQGTGTGTGGTM